MSVRTKKGEGVQFSRAEYRALLERIEDLEDAVRLIEDKRHEGKRDYLPAALVARLVAGEHPVKIWRDHRGLKLAELAAESGVSASYVSEIETGKKPGSVDAIRKLAAGLKVEIDDLIR